MVGNGGGHRYLIHDRDRIFAKHLDDSIRALGVEVLRSPVASPKANAICERVIGTARRECLDWLIPVSGRVILSDYATLTIEVLKDNSRPDAGAVYGALAMPFAVLVGQIAKAYGK